ncbi:regulator of sigma E protease [Sarcina sp. DSM 11001]|uniref:RIP metalloprotease RseP n=1 Tax=Sarcina sp. DSM 11001 TaxID=1798184 RepID=UPI000886ABFC|nr:RIP metalloprotease RseP [Sarcina sp. DSM 11001]SDK56737.1 regulator of sigma E protease [Sarcina sp. DSM 11001]
MIVSILIFLIIFSVIVISHEFGHFAVARRGGIRVLEFDIGMGPVLFRKEGKETDLCIRLLPIGGACIFDGMEEMVPEEGEAPRELDEHSFPNTPVGSRIAAVLAGPMANFILGFVFSLILVAFTGTDLPVIREIVPDSAAMEAGLEAGDVIRKINGETIHIYREVSLISAMNYGEPLHITYERDGERRTVDLIPRFDEEDNRYYIGIMGSGEYLKCNPVQVFQYGFYETAYWLKATYKSLGLIFRGHFSKDDISGPVGVVKIVDDTYTETAPYGLYAVFLTFLSLASLLTVNLGVINLLPIPALDGGRLLFLLLELVRGKPIPPEKEGMVHLAGFAFLMLVMILVLFNDISRFFH